MKRKQKIFNILFVFFLVFFLSSNVLAKELKTNLKIIQKESEVKDLKDEKVYLSKSIVDSDLENGEVTIELKLSNTKEDLSLKEDTEIFLVIDNSGSMDYKATDGRTRKSILLDSTRKFVDTILKENSNVKMGVIKFHGKYATLIQHSAAELVTNLTKDKSAILDGITTIENTACEGGTNIQDALIKAKKSFSNSDSKKMIILLTDGLPNEDKSSYVADKEMIMTNQKYLQILENTKNELMSVNKDGMTTISLMTGINSGDVNSSGEVISSTEDDIKAIKLIFGTEENSTVGKFYNCKTMNVEEVVKNDITKDVQSFLGTPIHNVKIVDYFPEEIIENFEFSYVDNPNIGSTSEAIDIDTNTITWDIGNLKVNEAATLRYKLKLTNMQNLAILNKEISTNEKVVLTYSDVDSKNKTITLNDSPKIQLVEWIPEQEKKEDNTIANKVLPSAGITNIFIIVTLAILVIIILVFISIKMMHYRKIK